MKYKNDSLGYVRSSHQRRGIMTVAIGALMKEWMIPRMNAHRLHATILEGNEASVRVFEKNGFVLKETLKVVKEGDFGRVEGLHVLEWKW
jgi:RimJ/RimL family protein N-acetyltransferase